MKKTKNLGFPPFEGIISVDGYFSICCSTLSSNKKQITASLGASLGCTIIVFNAKTQDLNLLFNVITKKLEIL